MKTVFAPHLNRNVKFGRKRPIATVPHLKLGNYLRASLPSAPAKYDNMTNPAVQPIISDVMLNDELGDCGIAGYYHIKGIETANAGKPFHATAAQLKALYHSVGGYVDGDPSTDNGIILTDLLNFVMHNADAGGSKIAGYAAVDATSPSQVMSAIELFGGSLYLGLELPDTYTGPFPSGNGFVWDTGTPDPEQGHCIISGAYDSTGAHAGIDVITWGLRGRLTFAALAELCVAHNGGECWVILTHDQIAVGQSKALNGFAWNDLVYDLNSIGGNAVPPPPPVQPPPPSSGGVSLAQAEAVVRKAFTGPPLFMSSSQATAKALKALESLPGWPK